MHSLTPGSLRALFFGMKLQDFNSDDSAQLLDVFVAYSVIKSWIPIFGADSWILWSSKNVYFLLIDQFSLSLHQTMQADAISKYMVRPTYYIATFIVKMTVKVRVP